MVAWKEWEWPEQWSPRLFLIAGLLLVVAAVAAGTSAVNGVERSPIGSMVGPAGLAIGFVGLLGLYPKIADRALWLTRAGAVFASLGPIGYIGITMGNFISFIEGNPAAPPGWPLSSFLL